MKLLALAVLAAAVGVWPSAAAAQDADSRGGSSESASELPDRDAPPAEAAQSAEPANAKAADDPEAPAPEKKPALSFGPGEIPTASSETDSLDLWAEQIVYESSAPAEDGQEQKADTFTCTDNVIVTLGVSRIECDKLVGTLGKVAREDPATGKSKNEDVITELVATGSPLKMTSGGNKAECLKAVYRLADNTITLTGDDDHEPVVTFAKGQVMHGKEIIFTIIGKDVKVTINRGGGAAPVPKGKVPAILK